MTDPTATNEALAAYQIPDHRLAELRGKVTRLARRAAKMKMAPLVLREVHTGSRVAYKERAGRSVTYELSCTWCELDGASPVLAGYAFLARVEHTDAGNLVQRPAGADETVDLTAYRTAKPICDHCKARRARHDTFVLRAPDGVLKQIGRNCLADYLRSDNAEVVVAIMALTHELSAATGGDDDPDAEFSGGGGWREILPVLTYVAAAVSAVRQCGWVSRGSVRAYEEAGGSGKEPTADVAAFITGRCPEGRGAERWRQLQPTNEDGERAVKILAWVKDTTDPSDYMYNLRVAAAQPAVTGRTQGLLASAVTAYEREVEKIEAAKRAPKVDAGYFGEEKKRYDLVGTVTFVREIPGYRDGVKTIIGLESPDGHRFTWFASGERDVGAGDRVELRGTVKKHELYKDRHQTVITRCEIKSVVTREKQLAAPTEKAS